MYFKNVQKRDTGKIIELIKSYQLLKLGQILLIFNENFVQQT